MVLFTISTVSYTCVSCLILEMSEECVIKASPCPLFIHNSDAFTPNSFLNSGLAPALTSIATISELTPSPAI